MCLILKNFKSFYQKSGSVFFFSPLGSRLPPQPPQSDAKQQKVHQPKEMNMIIDELEVNLLSV